MNVKIAVLMPDDAARASFITPAVKRELERVGEAVYSNAGYDPPVMAELLDGADICVTGWGCPALDGEILAKASRLRLVAHTGGSVAAIMSPALSGLGVPVISGNELYAESVAEGALAYMLAGLRRIPYYSNSVQKGEWRPHGYGNKGLLDRKVGLVGFGAITRKLLPMLKPFRVKILVCSKHLSDEECESHGMIPATMEQLFSSCDIVSLHMARTPQTYHAVNRELLGLMPDGSLLVNTARGSVVDEQALADELQTERIHAVLDVFEEEPLPADSRLRGLDNAVLIPHMGGPTGDRHEFVSMALIEDMKRMLSGRPMENIIGNEHAVRMTNDALKL
ncbi:MAG: hydroxyacid dehydrogenase [Defluviitaleaceae bacterium]|nr:hydroxyacid dehydrogenase [Defluviitaleaceae bacterium]